MKTTRQKEIHTTFRSGLALCLFFCMLLCFASVTNALAEATEKEKEQTYRHLEVFSNVLSILQDNYVEEIETKAVLDGAIKGLLFSLDPHSSYLLPEDFKELQEETQGEFSGIGIEIVIKDGLLTVVAPIEDTPADRAGLRANDIILEIDGVKTKTMGPFEAVKKLKGEPGTDVTLSIHRKGSAELKNLTITRDIIPIASVKLEQLAKGLVYTRITHFQSNTAKTLKTAYSEIEQAAPIEGVILDLRNNPGGLLQQAVAVTDIFLSKGTIVYTKGRHPEQDTVFSAHNNRQRLDCPLVVLVNEGSASAAEIVAGALQANKRGIIVGMQTFGKGTVQTVIPLPDGSGLRMTTAKYYTPDDRSIQALGITPDIEVPYLLPAMLTKNSKRAKTTEATLAGHLPQTEEDTSDTEDSSVKEKREERLANDNQLRTAYNILKSLVLLAADQQKR